MASTIGEFPPSFTQRQLCVHLLGVREKQSVRSIATHAYGGTQLCTGQIVCVCACVCEGGGEVVTHCLETLQNVIHDSDYCRAAVCHITGALPVYILTIVSAEWSASVRQKTFTKWINSQYSLVSVVRHMRDSVQYF